MKGSDDLKMKLLRSVCEYVPPYQKLIYLFGVAQANKEGNIDLRVVETYGLLTFQNCTLSILKVYIQFFEYYASTS
jgi:hypothetical protein